MPQSSKDNNGGKNHPAKSNGASSAKKSGKDLRDNSASSPTGSHNKGEKKTTP